MPQQSFLELHLAVLKTYSEGEWRHVSLRLNLVESAKFSLQLLTSLEEPVSVITTTALFLLLIRQLHHQ